MNLQTTNPEDPKHTFSLARKAKDFGKPARDRQFYKAHPVRSHKYMVSEGGLRVPFLVSGPGIPAGVSSRQPVVGWDILPTVLDMAGARDHIPGHVEGGSLVAHCQSGGKGQKKKAKQK